MKKNDKRHSFNEIHLLFTNIRQMRVFVADLNFFVF